MISIIVGLQFGDEGKGKITDFISGDYDLAVRFNGGGNAGHTVVTDEGKFKFHLMPSAALRVKTVVLGNGMVVDPIALIEEIAMLKQANPNVDVKVSKNAHVVTAIHKRIDRGEEELRSKNGIGTTGQGIGPTYEDKSARTGIRMGDLLDLGVLQAKLEMICAMKRSVIGGSDYIDKNAIAEVADALQAAGKKLGGNMVDSGEFVESARLEGKNILFEGAQGALLDIDFGIYPFVTSSNTISGAVHTGAGFPLRKVDRIIGVVKAYTSRVGAGPFPTELLGKDAERLRGLGNEFGTTTGRPRRVGWLDLPLLKYAIKINDIDSIALTRLDTLGLMDEIKVCYSYGGSGGSVENVIRNEGPSSAPEPKYRSFAPWEKIASGENSFESLPKGVKEYVKFIEKEAGKPVEMISVGEKRGQTVIKTGFAKT